MSGHLRMGRFVWIDDRVVLVAHNGDVWPIEWVTLQAGGWGWSADGVAKLPRPWRYDPRTSQPIVRGDNVVIEFINGHPKRVLVRAGVVAITRDAFLQASYDAEGSERYAAQLKPTDPTTGAVRGVVRAQAGPADGTLDIEVLLPDEETVQALIRMGQDGAVEVRAAGRVTLGGTVEGGGAAEPVLKTSTYLAAESQAIVQELPVFGAAAALFGLPFDAIATRAAELAAAASSPTATPYGSTKVESE